MAEFKIPALKKQKQRGVPIAAITAYDLFTAQLAEEAGVDFILVGDSLGNVVQGQPTTLPVTLEEIIYHTRIVMRSVRDTLVIADMPFGSFKVTADETVKNALRVFKETGCGGVKMEGADETNLQAITRLQRLGVPAMGHLGLLPQMVHTAGGYRTQGRSEKSRQRLLAEAKALQEAGVFLLILECVEAETARLITRELKIPTVGIGSGPHVDGQILVIHDALGMLRGSYPSFARTFAHLREDGVAGLKMYVDAVREREYPADAEYVRSSAKETASGTLIPPGMDENAD
ncbi:MAG: 3-methyl-2-oxobutanoate hydroxymethyltransferase [Planctomycetales bacterium 4484_113]|nr:MAG: 3-methyl-2-oxobutanoate hydroxymethyltransferase [Planctomycetales bacterium 4484_113]